MRLIKHHSVSDSLLDASAEHVLVETIEDQRSERLLQVVILCAVDPDDYRLLATPQALKRLGYIKKSVVGELRGFVDGRNLAVEFRSTRQEPRRLFADVADLVRSDVDLIVAAGPEVAVNAVLAASRTIPIVMWANNFDPITSGYVQSLARPGGNVTGLFTRQPELAAKQVEILKETFPDRTRSSRAIRALVLHGVARRLACNKMQQMQHH
jgi:ABC transporter substrate binding protein